jgi:hypothetical protein
MNEDKHIKFSSAKIDNMFVLRFWSFIPKPVWAVGFAHEQTLRDATLAVFSFLILKRLQHKILAQYFPKFTCEQFKMYEILNANI